MTEAPSSPSGQSITIGGLAERAGLPITTIRYYEKRGLLDPPGRVGGKRVYRPDVLMRLMVIRFCRIAGLTLEQIGDVVNDTSPGRRITKTIAAERVADIQSQVLQLQLAEQMLRAAIDCVCPSVEQCECGAMDDATGRMQAAGLGDAAPEING
ncbi:MAG: MerR family transcriptional regulator [Actinomycetota bacterium]